MPHSGSPVVINGERMPGPFFIERDRAEIPDAAARERIAGEVYGCYRRQIASENLIERLLEIFALK